MKCLLVQSDYTRSSTCLASYKKCEQVSVRMVNSGSIPLRTTMIIINKITGRDVSREYLALMKGIITRDEFELITLTIK